MTHTHTHTHTHTLSLCITFQTQDGVTHTVDHFDLCILHPECRNISVSGARHFPKKREDGSQRAALEFFGECLKVNCERKAIENPVNIVSGEYVKEYYPDLCEKYGFPIKPTQAIQPYFWRNYFGEPNTKKTCLWLKNLPPLVADTPDKPEIEYHEWIDKKTGKKKRQDMWSYGALHKAKNADERRSIRSRTFKGVAKAMAEQWGPLLPGDYEPMNPKQTE